MHNSMFLVILENITASGKILKRQGSQTERRRSRSISGENGAEFQELRVKAMFEQLGQKCCMCTWARGGVSNTVGGADAPPTLRFAPPPFSDPTRFDCFYRFVGFHLTMSNTVNAKMANANAF